MLIEHKMYDKIQTSFCCMVFAAAQNPADIYLCKVNKEKHQNNVWNLFKTNNKDTSVFTLNSEQT